MTKDDQSLIYQDGRHYDLKYGSFVDDIPFLYGLILKYGEPVLELGCGTGRIAIPLAQQGVKIAGLDLSGTMLAEAIKKADRAGTRVEWIQADCRNFRLGRRFMTIFFPFNSIMHLIERRGVEACLACVKEHLEETGRFILDVINPDPRTLLTSGEADRPVLAYPDPDGKGVIEVLETSSYDRTARLRTITWQHRIQGRLERTEVFCQRIYFPEELSDLIKNSGLVLEKKFGDYDASPFTSISPQQILVCRVKGRQ